MEGLDAVAVTLPKGARLHVRQVEFDQQVVVVAHDRPPIADRRRSAWLRVSVGLVHGENLSTAVWESVEPSASAVRAGIDSALERADARKGAARVRAEDHEIVLAPGLGGIVAHELIGHPLEADAWRSGDSWLHRAGADRFECDWTVVDDPRRGRAGWQFDDEGTPARAVALMSSGRIRGRLETRATAGNDDALTGHGRRATYRDAVLPRMGCTFVAAGRGSGDELTGSVTEGILVRRMEAAHVDGRDGVAWFRVTDADRLHHGRPVQALSPFIVEIRGEALLGGRLRVADDLRFDPCIGSCHKGGQAMAMGVGAPTIWIGVHRVIA